MCRSMLVGACLISVCVPTSIQAQKVPPEQRAGVIARALERLRSGMLDHPLLRRHQRASLDIVYWAGVERAAMPGNGEIARFRDRRSSFGAEALEYLDEFYGLHDELKALALRDSDADGVPDFRVSDYYGKFMEGDVDVDGDGVRNVLDSHPYDKTRVAVTDRRSGLPSTVLTLHHDVLTLFRWSGRRFN